MAQRHNDFIQALTSGSAPIGPGVMGLDQATMDAINFENIKSAINRNINLDPQGDIRTFNVNDEYSDSELMESDTTSDDEQNLLNYLRDLSSGAFDFGKDMTGRAVASNVGAAALSKINPLLKIIRERLCNSINSFERILSSIDWTVNFRWSGTSPSII